MNVSLTWVLMIMAFICFLLATFGVGSRVNLLAAGLAFWSLSLVLAFR